MEETDKMVESQASGSSGGSSQVGTLQCLQTTLVMVVQVKPNESGGSPEVSVNQYHIF